MEEGDLIAKRTRSQLPLQDVPIESIEGILVKLSKQLIKIDSK